ncbi:MAG TPA: 2-oxo-4-hydroxy-4-carboxy-5-ureidoimidazoline decarboxylase [Burkholderiales bacterium]|nr:2-oxo-4-hydroxy-4-carboxy-5-ureidoimidazoline decarboxylase [Burkholderiales bacterium]
MALEAVNSLGKQEFVARLGGVFEHSPWIAERAWRKRPFRSLEDLHQAMLDAVVSRQEKLKLVHAHPELACGESLTVDSTSEQARLGFNRLSKDELEEMNRLNRSYREKFGFPCIVALRLHGTRESVMAEMARRLRNLPEAELSAAMEQIGHITRGRLEKILNG